MATLTPATPPFTRKHVGAHYVWSRELETALAFAVANGLQMFLTDAPYQVAKLIGERVVLVIYPHKTSGTRNVSLRVRNENSHDKAKALALMDALEATVPTFNTFSRHWTSSNYPKASA